METQATKERDEIAAAMILNVRSDELTRAADALRFVEEPIARSVVGFADAFAADVRNQVRNLIRRHPDCLLAD